MKINKTYSVKNIHNLEYSFNETPFGEVLVAWNDGGICAVIYILESHDKAQDELHSMFPFAHLEQSTHRIDLFSCGDVAINFVGTPFQILVWTAILEIPAGTKINYARLAKELGCPKSVRAVAAAVEQNPIGYIVPCHRVVDKNPDKSRYESSKQMRRAICEYEKQTR